MLLGWLKNRLLTFYFILIKLNSNYNSHTQLRAVRLNKTVPNLDLLSTRTIIEYLYFLSRAIDLILERESQKTINLIILYWVTNIAYVLALKAIFVSKNRKILYLMNDNFFSTHSAKPHSGHWGCGREWSTETTNKLLTVYWGKLLSVSHERKKISPRQLGDSSALALDTRN